MNGFPSRCNRCDAPPGRPCDDGCPGPSPTRALAERFDAMMLAAGDLHPSSQRFVAILLDLVELHARKGQDYGTDADPFANVRAAGEWGVSEWLGAALRLGDKVKRLQAFARRGTLANEGVVDAFDDLAVYAVIARVLYEEAEETKHSASSA